MNHRTSMIVHPIELTDWELGVLAICATRYCLETNSALTPSVQRVLEKLNPVLSKGDRDGIATSLFCAMNRELALVPDEERRPWQHLLKMFSATI